MNGSASRGAARHCSRYAASSVCEQLAASPVRWLPAARAIKNPLFVGGGFGVPVGTYKESDDDLLSQARCLLSLARERFTVLFGMGRGGSTLLWSSDKGVGVKVCGLDPAFELSGGAVDPGIFSRLLYSRGRVAGVLEEGYGLSLHRIHTLHASQNYRIKPHGQLVRVSLTHYCASTPRLSTLWSSTTL